MFNLSQAQLENLELADIIRLTQTLETVDPLVSQLITCAERQEQEFKDETERLEAGLIDYEKEIKGLTSYRGVLGNPQGVFRINIDKKHLGQQIELTSQKLSVETDEEASLKEGLVHFLEEIYKQCPVEPGREVLIIVRHIAEK